MEEFKYCSHCGNQVLKEAEICPKCGCRVANSDNTSHKNDGIQSDIDSFGYISLFLVLFLSILGWLIVMIMAFSTAKKLGFKKPDELYKRMSGGAKACYSIAVIIGSLEFIGFWIWLVVFLICLI